MISFILALSIHFTALPANDVEQMNNITVQEDLTVEMSEDGDLTCARSSSTDDGSQTDVDIDDLAMHVESDGCWVKLNWCDKPGPGTWECSCTGCSPAKCISACVSLVKQTC